MGALGDMFSNAVSAAKEQTPGSTLQTFLQKFTSGSGKYVDTLDPLGTFDVKIEFQPTISFKELEEKEKPSTLSRVGSSLLNSLKSMGTGALDKLTGGLFSAATLSEKDSVMKKKAKFEQAGQHTVMEYLAPANLLVGGEQWQNAEQAAAPLVLNIGPYVQSITIPQLKVDGETKSDTALGEFPVTGNVVRADGVLVMEVLNTKAALHERIFYPWMRECTFNWWSYEQQPYTTATITVDFTKHNDVKYVFCGCRPDMIVMMNAKQEASSGNLTRNVQFIYDYMFVVSKLNVIDSVGDKLAGAGGSLLGGAAKLLKL